MKLRNHGEFKRHTHLLKKEVMLIEELVKGKYDVMAFMKRANRLGKQVLSLSSASFENFEDYEKEIIKFKKTLSNSENLEEAITHEKEHGEVCKKYGVPCFYAIIIRKYIIDGKLHYQYQPYVQNIFHEEAKNWDKENLIRFLREMFATGVKYEEKGKRDSEVVRIIDSYKE